MPTTKSAIRRVKRTRFQTSVNRIRKSKYKSAVKQMSSYIASGKMKGSPRLFTKIPLTIDENSKNWCN